MGWFLFMIKVIGESGTFSTHFRLGGGESRRDGRVKRVETKPDASTSSFRLRCCFVDSLLRRPRIRLLGMEDVQGKDEEEEQKELVERSWFWLEDEERGEGRDDDEMR